MPYRNVCNPIELRLEHLKVYYSKAEDLLRLYRETRSRCDRQRERIEQQLARVRQTRSCLGLRSKVDE